MSLSSGLTLADLSDYLAPSQLCIKPVTMVEDTSATPPEMEIDTPSTAKGAATTEIMIDEETLAYYEKGEKGTRGKKLKKAEITLNDCLACSGCITSAESVLVSLQSHEEVYRVLEEQPDLVPIMSISPQSVASLAALYDLDLASTMLGLRTFFKQEMGFRLVFDTTFSRSLSLSENRLEYLERRSHSLSSSSSSPSSPSTLASSTLDPTSSSTGPLPILSSSCPGWICYAEKTHGELLPFVSNVKSSQAVMGVLVKRGEVANRLGLRPDQIYHVTVMPCYDKKLEASRPDFTTLSPSSSSSSTTTTTSDPIRDVDCVLTTGEVDKILLDKGFSLRSLALSSTTTTAGEEEEEELSYLPSTLLSPLPGSTSSGGYLHNALSSLVSSLSPSLLTSARMVEKRVRSDDYVEYSLVVRDGGEGEDGVGGGGGKGKEKVLGKGAKCYGFRNLQNVVRKIGRENGVTVSRGAAGRLPVASVAGPRRRGTTVGAGAEVEFVEVMACPGGCVNGGGQMPPPKNLVQGGSGNGVAVKRKWAGELDREGMPEMGVSMDLELEEKVLSPKEWVAKVERVYWSGSTMEVEERGVEWEKVDRSLWPYLLASKEEEMVEKAVERLLELNPGEEDKGKRRRELLRTSYRAVESEEVNGLAVKW